MAPQGRRVGPEADVEPGGDHALHDEPAGEGVQGEQGGQAVDRPARAAQAERGGLRRLRRRAQPKWSAARRPSDRLKEQLGIAEHQTAPL
jgi:hypothetical protein